MQWARANSGRAGAAVRGETATHTSDAGPVKANASKNATLSWRCALVRTKVCRGGGKQAKRENVRMREAEIERNKREERASHDHSRSTTRAAAVRARDDD